jgi:hypothetical protein
MKSIGTFFCAALAVIIGSAQPVAATPNCRPCPYDCSDLGLGHKDCSELERGARGVCCVDLSSKGVAIAKEQERILGQNAPAARSSNDRCPSGFQPSEQKCSPEERRRGCKDIRTPSGLGCVKR